MSTFLGMATVETRGGQNEDVYKSTSLSLHKDRFSSLIDKNGKVPVFVLKNDTTGKHEVHSEVEEGKRHGIESSLYLDKAKVLELSAGEQGYIQKIFTSSKQNPEEGKPDLSVYTLKENGEKNYIGNGFENRNKLENSVKMSTYSEGDGTNTTKLFNVKMKGSEVDKLEADSWGNVKVLINKTGAENEHKVVFNEKAGKDTDAILVLNKDKLMAIAQENGGAIRLIARDKNPDKISNDKADLMAYENKFRKGDEKLSKEELAEKFKNINFVGGGYTNNPNLLKLSSENLTSEGLKKSIERNEPVRTFAIINKDSSLVGKVHVDAVRKTAAINPKFSKGIETAVTNALKKNEEGLGKKAGSVTPEVKTPKVKGPKLK